MKATAMIRCIMIVIVLDAPMMKRGGGCGGEGGCCCREKADCDLDLGSSR